MQTEGQFMLAQQHFSVQEPEPGEEACPRCGSIDQPTLVPGTGPHSIRAECGHCGRFFRWMSLLAPTERMARKAKARLTAMQAHPPSNAQLEYLKTLGDQAATPKDMAEASERIEALKRKSVTR